MKVVVWSTVLYFLLINPLSAQNKLKSIVIEEILTIGGLDNDLIFQWTGIATDEEGNIYVTDLKDYSIKKFDKKGKFIIKAGKKGQGPGEFDSPNIVGYFDNRIYVSEIYRPGIHVFDRNLSYLFKIPVEYPINDLNVISNNQIVTSGLKFDRSDNGIFFYDSSGKEEKSIVYDSGKEHPMIHPIIKSISFEIDVMKNIYIAYNWIDRIIKIDKDGKVLFDKNLLGIKKVKTKKIGGREFPEKVVFKAVELDRKGYIFILGGNLSKNPSRDIYVFNKDGEHLTTFPLPEDTHTIHIDKNNYLYSRADEGITIKKYALKYIYE